jgi:hypothetical protein
VYCNRDYKIFENFQRHHLCCEFFHKTRKERCLQKEEFETLPSQRDLFRIVQDLVIRCNHLEKEVHSLKDAANRKKRKEVVEYLNQIVAPEMTFKEWSANQPIEFHHLQCVFEYNLTEGIKLCIDDYMKNDPLGIPNVEKKSQELLKYAHIPISAFEQNPNVFYIYDSSGSNASPLWKRMEGDVFERWISTLSHKFLQYFIEWQSDNLSQQSTDKDKEENILYMIKVNGGRNPLHDKERRISELRKWLFSKIKRGSLVEMV